ncbi:hypothetical protein O9K51_01412 [Purpureocillium lavendulum]|uniref:Uncharacterized protein n=1 Tax=Purpureocillium lavendulum TaxID=1247861 RepID=A0AB34G562_9HYPO|nr:hypothetical protein O9K51_01412 [Purpureocillium lavendulum]
MKFSTIIAAVASGAVVAASPVDRRQVGGVLLCTGPEATGTCQHMVAPMGQCQQLSAPFYQNTTTFAPDGEYFSCFPSAVDCGGKCTSPTGCTAGGIDYDYENKYDLSEIGWHKIMASFVCRMDPDRN